MKKADPSLRSGRRGKTARCPWMQKRLHLVHDVHIFPPAADRLMQSLATRQPFPLHGQPGEQLLCRLDAFQQVVGQILGSPPRVQ